MIYTKTGDTGTTSLVGGTRVPKYDVRVEAYGTVDELGSHIGLLAEMLREKHRTADEATCALLKQVQRDLFVVQTLLATEKEVDFALPQLSTESAKKLEQAIDAIQEALPKLHTFVLPGGNVLSAQCHVARTVCRRAERRIVQLDQQAPVPPAVMQYINRLSDYLFVLARHFVVSFGDKEDLV